MKGGGVKIGERAAARARMVTTLSTSTLSRPLSPSSVIGGFMSGASIIIGLNQVKFLFGYDKRPSGTPGGKPISFPRADNLQDNLANIFSKDWLPLFKWQDFVMGLSWLAILIFMKESGKLSRRLVWLRAFGPLTVTILSTALTAGLHLDKAPHKIKVVGVVPKGLPHQTVSLWFPMEHVGKKAGLAVLVCLIDVLESISIAKSLAIKNRYELNATQELRGLGLANLVGAAFNCYTTTGSFSRSAVMDTVGAKTQAAGLTGGILVMLTLLVLTPLFRLMPNNAQGAIIISAVIGLIQVRKDGDGRGVGLRLSLSTSTQPPLNPLSLLSSLFPLGQGMVLPVAHQQVRLARF